MAFTKSILLVLILFFTELNSFAQNSALKMIDTDDLKRHLSFISSDSLQGRSFGTPTPGLDITADYLKSVAKETGLAEVAGNYFQMVPIVSSHPDLENSFLEIIGTDEKVIIKTDSVIGIPQGNNIDISNADIVFAGFGYISDKHEYDDFKGLDLRGKVVMFTTGSPELFKNGELPRWNNNLETSKVKRAMEAGAAGVILINSPLDTENTVYNRLFRWFSKTNYSLESSEKKTEKISFVFITSSQADLVLGKTGRLYNLLSEISEENQPQSFYLEGKRAKFTITGKTENIQAKNVIGMIEGSDPILKNECVIFMAHYDHLGTDNFGNVFNGADDNGSGTVTLLEVAEAFAMLEEKPRRSIVFLWVTAEEVGMLGSHFYAENSLFPLDKTVACINVDMDGRVFEQRDTVWNKSPKLVKDFDGLFIVTNKVWPGLKKFNTTICKSLGLKPDYSLPSSFLHSSDHFSFHNKGVPVLNFSTGYHADYHQITDEISRINFDKMKRVADLCFLLGLKIANQKSIKTSVK